MIKDVVAISFRHLAHRKLRSFLTVLGVVIGVAAIIGMVSSTQAISGMITREIEKFQTDVIEIIPGEFKLGFMLAQATKADLTERDAELIASIGGVEAVSANVHKTAELAKGRERYYLTVMGVDENFERINTIGIYRGRYPKKGREALLGYSVAHDLFEKPVGVKEKILIQGKEFKVVGIMNKAGGIFKSVDSIVYIPKKTLREIFDLDKEKVDVIEVKVEAGVDPEVIAEEIEYRLAKAHGVREDEKDFTVFSPTFSKKVAAQITGMLQVLLGSVAGISFVVGAIGIANMMFTSVLERTREIGIMKAIGASDRDVMLIFLTESGVVGLIGGLIGIFAGYALGQGFLLFRHYMLLRTGVIQPLAEVPVVKIDLAFSLFALVISFAIGILAGLLPARRAAKLQPVEALRYE